MGRLLLVAAVGLVACFPDETITTSPSGEPETGGTVEQARVGDTLRLSGYEEALEMAVTVQQVYDPAKPHGRFNRPQSGMRYVAVELTLENVGSAVYRDSPSNGAYLIDAEGQQFSTWLGSQLDDCQDLGSPRIAPGDSRLGCVVFQVPEEVVVERFQFTLESGFGPETGEWQMA